jgi:hypothetical protein
MFHLTHWMSVFTTNDENEAHMIAGELEANGIMARLHQELANVTYNQFGEITVLVDNRDHRLAQAILSRTLLEVAVP